MTCLSSTNNSGENEGFLKTGGLKKVINFEDILKSAWKSNLNFFTVSQEQLGFQENLFLTPYRLYLHGICSIFYAPFVKLLSPSHTLCESEKLQNSVCVFTFSFMLILSFICNILYSYIYVLQRKHSIKSDNTMSCVLIAF